MDAIFHRTILAARLANQVLNTAATSASSSGLFLAAPRRTGKTTFMRADLMPALRVLGARVIYVDLWADPKADPGNVIVTAIRTQLAQNASALAKIAKSLGVVGANLAGIDFSLAHIGLGKNISLAQALAVLSDEINVPIVLIIDEAQQAITTQMGSDAMFSLKAARDELNLAHAGLRIVCTGSNRDKLAMLRASKEQAFFGAPLIDFPMLGDDYVAWFCDTTDDLPAPLQPALVAPLFKRAGNRPEILDAAADQLRFDFDLVAQDVDRRFTESVEEQIARSNIELRKIVRNLPPMQSAILRVLADAGEQYAPFVAETMEQYRAAYRAAGETLGSEDFSTANVQQNLLALQEKGLVWRASRGVYALEDHNLKDNLT